MSWANNDYKMVSCGMEGAIYDWDIINQARVGETIIKSCAFSDVVTSSTAKSFFAVGSDGFIREIRNGNIHREVMVYGGALDTVVLSNSDQMLFVSGNDGIVYSVKLPILDNAEYMEFAGHSTLIQRVRISI